MKRDGGRAISSYNHSRLQRNFNTEQLKPQNPVNTLILTTAGIGIRFYILKILIKFRLQLRFIYTIDNIHLLFIASHWTYVQSNYVIPCYIKIIITSRSECYKFNSNLSITLDPKGYRDRKCLLCKLLLLHWAHRICF